MTTDSAPPATAADPRDPAATMPTTRARDDERPGSRPMTDEDTRADGGHRGQPRRDPGRAAEAGADAAGRAGDDPAARDSLIAHERAEGYRTRWAAAQGDFIDEPRTAGWLIQSEVFPTAVRGRAAAIGASVDWLANFVIILAFPALNTAFGLGWVMVLFAVLAVLAIVFIARYLPETKGLPLEDVVEVFERQAHATSATS
jgi:Sugar (and other) transporter